MVAYTRNQAKDGWEWVGGLVSGQMLPRNAVTETGSTVVRFGSGPYYLTRIDGSACATVYKEECEIIDISYYKNSCFLYDPDKDKQELPSSLTNTQAQQLIEENRIDDIILGANGN